MNTICAAEPCPVILNSTCVFYTGANLIYTGIQTNDNLQTALQKRSGAQGGRGATGRIHQPVRRTHPGVLRGSDQAGRLPVPARRQKE